MELLGYLSLIALGYVIGLCVRDIQNGEFSTKRGRGEPERWIGQPPPERTPPNKE